MTDHRPVLFGVHVDPLTMSQTVARCVELIEERRLVQHVVLNAGKVVLMRDDPELARIVSGCDMVNADGMSIVWAGRLLGVRFPERVAGIDLMVELLSECAERGWPVFVLGATDEVLSDFVSEATVRFPGLKFAGLHNGYFDDDEAVARTIGASGARMVLVGMPSPRKERFLAAQGHTMGPVFAMGVGGSLDVIAGKTKRAPAWMQRSGLEWLYRFAQEPRRMWRRYLVGNARFLGLIVGEAVNAVLGRGSDDA